MYCRVVGYGGGGSDDDEWWDKVFCVDVCSYVLMMDERR